MPSARSIFFSLQTTSFLAIFAAVRLLSYGLSDRPYAQAVLVFIWLCVFGVVFFRQREYAWLMLLGEIFLGGSGHMLEFFGLSLRTLTVLTFLLLWSFFAVYERARHRLRIPHALYYLALPLFSIAVFSSGMGISRQHGAGTVIADALPFVFLALMLPAHHLLERARERETLIRLVLAFLVSSSLLSLFTYAAFVSGVFELQDSFYHWFRDVAMGKITPVTPYFYRIVLPEHLLIPPLALVMLSLSMRPGRLQTLWRVLYALGSLVLVLNFSRGYFLGLIAGALILKYRHRLLPWLKETALAALVLVGILAALNGVASRGQSFGLEILGFRFASIVEPNIETSAATRLRLLRPIRQLIAERPLTGHGFGASLTYTDPVTYESVTTRQFDWGYLELAAELGLIGTGWYLALIALIVYEITKKIRRSVPAPDWHIGLLSALASLLVITVTAPALTHVFGIVFLALTIAAVTKPENLVGDAHALSERVLGARRPV